MMSLGATLRGPHIHTSTLLGLLLWHTDGGCNGDDWSGLALWYECGTIPTASVGVGLTVNQHCWLMLGATSVTPRGDW
jgi:hypothetical protein